MTNSNRKKLLVALDGSDHSLETVRYVAKLLSSVDLEVVLFHVLREMDDALLDVGLNPLYRGSIAEIAAWDLTRRKKVEEHMHQAHQILAKSGLNRVTINIHASTTGIARDILKESRKGYDAVVVGRKGLSNLRELILGSVAQKLIERVDHVPIWVVGRNGSPSKILLGLDGSEGSLKAVAHVGNMLGRSNSHITLLHVIRDIGNRAGKSNTAVAAKDETWLAEVQHDIQPKLNAAASTLKSAGFHPEHVTTKIITGASSRAGAIVGEARRGEYGTIVVGRRGLSKVKDFFMGRVSNKILHMGKEVAVWVTSQPMKTAESYLVLPAL